MRVSGLAKTFAKTKFRDVLKSADTSASHAILNSSMTFLLHQHISLQQLYLAGPLERVGGGGGVSRPAPSQILAEIKAKPFPDYTGL